MGTYQEVIEGYHRDKTKCFINGMPEENGGIILDIGQDYIVFEIENKEEKPEDTTVEKVIIPISKINMIGTMPVKKTGINSFAQSASAPDKIEIESEAEIKE